ncbi:murein hydrolase activator EnvC family protein [Streptomyces poriticola]|uniref:murein hydrolase activator EnvC family protein n=1 Tax=Streptomyces poriticola TaxID=3120506 RepID=UPI002FCDFDEB
MRTRQWVTATVRPVPALALALILGPYASLPPVPTQAPAARTAATEAGRARDPAVPAVARNWPVGPLPPAILRGWTPPATPYGAGHRGVDLAAPPGTPVRAVAPGRVSFAGRVAGRGVVAVELTGTGAPPLRTTYLPVHPRVERGEQVAAGQVVGTVAGAAPDAGAEPGRSAHCATSCLHWGLLRGSSYLDPLSLLPLRLLNGGPSRLLPVAGVPVPR